MLSQQQATEFVVQGLGRGIRREDLIQSLCGQTGGTPQQIEYFVRKIEIEHREVITAIARQIAQQKAPQPAPRQAGQPPIKGLTSYEAAPQQAGGYQVYEKDQSQAAEFAAYELDQWQKTEAARPEVDRQASVEFVLDGLKKDVDKSEIIRALCEENNWDWDQAKRFVQRVEIQHFDQIATSQSPLMVSLGVAGILVGVALIISMIYLTLNGISLRTVTVLVPYLRLIPFIENVALLITGVGLVLGGIASTWQTINTWLELKRSA